MIIDSFGLPRFGVANDFADSSMLAGMMAIFDHPLAPNLDKYFVSGKPVRHPYEITYPENEPRCMSRDQLILLEAGCLQQESPHSDYMVGKWFAPNNLDEKTRKWKMPDPLSPSAQNHFYLCGNQSGFWLGYKWLEWDINYNAQHTPLREPNQLIAMCMVAGPKYIRMYKSSCDWKQALRLYWCDDRPNPPPPAAPLYYNRGEKEFCEFMIKKLEAIV